MMLKLLGFALTFVQTAVTAQTPLPAVQQIGQAPTATVVFYAQGGMWKGTARQVFTLGAVRGESFSIGHIFDGQDRLTLLVPRRYAVFALSPGAHIFSASLTKKHADTKEHLDLTLEAGKSYFLRLTTDSGSLKPFNDETQSFLMQTSCQAFQEEVVQNHLSEVAAKRVEPRAAATLIAMQQPPICQP